MKRWIRRRFGGRIDRLAAWAEPAVHGRRWLAAGVAIGVLPFAVSLATGLPGHHMLAATLLAWACLGCARRDAWAKGIALLALTFTAHSLCVMVASTHWPERCAGILPGAELYWQKQLAWIETGEDPEYALTSWLTRHVLLIGMSLVWSFLSLGIQTFAHGFFEVDLMNFYNARLWSSSANPPLTLMLGWHVWSVLRGIGFLFATYEMISLSLEFWTGRTLVTLRLRRLRLGLAATFFLADGVTKHLLLEMVRQGLYDNLHGGL